MNNPEIWPEGSIFQHAIKRLKNRYKGGIDGIPSFIIKGCSDVLAPVLVHVFNTSFNQGVFPSLWKRTIVVPVFKGGDKCDVKSYRPI